MLVIETEIARARDVLNTVVQTHERYIDENTLFSEVSGLSTRDIRGAISLIGNDLIVEARMDAERRPRLIYDRLRKTREEIDTWDVLIQQACGVDYSPDDFLRLTTKMKESRKLEQDLEMENLSTYGRDSEHYKGIHKLKKQLNDGSYRFASLSFQNDSVLDHEAEIGEEEVFIPYHYQAVSLELVKEGPKVEIPLRDPDRVRVRVLTTDEYRALFRGMRWICINLLEWREPGIILPEQIDYKDLKMGQAVLQL